MAKRTNTRAIGAFVIGAVGLIVLAIVMLGSGNLFSERHTYVLFFKQNINGLRVGAPVKFNGVQIGQVNRILLNLELPHGDVEFEIPAQVQIPVLITIDDQLLVSHGGHIDLNDPSFIKRAIADGLRAQLGLESLLTGLLYVDLGMHPNAPLNLVLPPGSRYQEIPTIPNALQKVQQSAVHFFSRLDNVDIVKLVDSANTTLDSINQILQTREVRDTFLHLNQAAQRLGDTAVSIQRMVDNLDRSVGPLSKNLRANSANANRTLDEATATMREIRIMMEPTSPLVYQTDEALKSLSKAAKSINRLTDYLEEQPGALIRGRDYKDNSK